MHLKGNVLYVGNDEAPIYRSERYGLSGKPDYVLQEGGELVPVEMKSGRTPKGPLFSHIVQVAAYCLLLEDHTGRKVNRGMLKYSEAEFDVEFDENLRQIVLDEGRRDAPHAGGGRGPSQPQSAGKVPLLLAPGRLPGTSGADHSTVTLLARFLGLSMEQPLFRAA